MADINLSTSIITLNVNDARLQNKSIHLKGFKIQNIFFDINGIKSVIDTWKILKYLGIKHPSKRSMCQRKVTQEVRNYFELNENTTHQNLQSTDSILKEALQNQIKRRKLNLNHSEEGNDKEQK